MKHPALSHTNRSSFTLASTTLTVAAAIMLTACGGGGGDDASESPGAPSTPAPSSTLTEIPMLMAVGINTYPIGSDEANGFANLNRARTECGFGALTQDTRLDRAADGHGKYLVAEYLNATHYQTNRANPFFTGYAPEDRAIATGYLNADQSNGRVSEDISFGGVLPSAFNLANGVYNLLNAPYHALDVLAPYQHVGIAVQWPAKTGFRDRHAEMGIQAMDSAMVVKVGTTVSNGRATVQALPADDILTYPCTASTGPILNTFRGEVPDPFFNQRNYVTNPVGTPFYVVARHGSGLRVTSSKLTHIASGKVVPLMAPRHSDTELFPGTNQLVSNSQLMDWAFIFPDEGLEVGKYRMEITATIKGKTVNKVSEFTTTNTLLNLN